MIRIPSARFILMTGLLAACASAGAANTAGGTQIPNQAVATFDPTTPGGATQATSNTVITTVQAICAVSVTSLGGSDAAILPGDSSTLRFTVTNAGNTQSSIPVSASSSGATPAPGLSIYNDANNNGKIDAGEQVVSSVDLPADGVAHLIALVQTTESTVGDAAVTLVASCGMGGASGSAMGVVKITPPPHLLTEKSFTPTQIKPGDETTVNVTTTNDGKGESREVILTDILTDEIAMGLSFVAGSAQTNVGTLEYTTDGSTWSTQAVAPVRGIRVRVPKLAPNAQINLTFRMIAAESADGKIIPNTATGTTGSQTSSSTAKLDVHYTPGVAIGPVGNPLAPEGTPTDSQTRPFAVVGQQICFDHTLQNTGDVQDYFTVTITYPMGGATAVLYGADGKPLTQPLLLQPGESALVRVCYTPTQTGPLDTLITVNGQRGTTNTTTDHITDIQQGLPDLKKSYTATTVDKYGKTSTLDADEAARVGDVITYTLTVSNPYNRDLTNVVISDPLASHVTYQDGSASNGGTVSGAAGAQTVNWNLGTLPANSSVTLTFRAVVADTAVDGEKLTNIFNMVSTELPDPIKSNEVETPVWNADLLLTKKASVDTVTYGDRVTYTVTVTNTSTSTALNDVLLTDAPAKGLEYITSTSTLGGAPLVDPEITDGVMTWHIDAIPAGGTITVTYDMRVTPGVTVGKLPNVVTASSNAKGIKSYKATADYSINLDPLVFAPISDIVGTVFVDRNRNGLFDAGLDTPVERARVILAGGRLALSDTRGRYHFANVEYGTQAVRLDPNSVPYPPLADPQNQGLSGTKTIHLRGLTSVDFPLAPLGGDVAALRRTTLTLGDVTVEKAVYAVPNGYVVTLKVNTPNALADFQLSDPLPGGATLKEGSNTLTTNLPAGETNLTYHFDWTGEPQAATTDPVVSWRY